MFAKFYDIPPLPFQDIEKPKRCGWTDEWMDKRMHGPRENSIPPLQTQFAGSIIIQNSKTVATI